MDTAQGVGSRAAPTSEVLEGLNDLLQLDHDAIGAYQIAIEKLEDRDHADQIAGFRRDHERHIRELNEVIAELGGTPLNEPHATGPFKQALQSLGGLAGDKGVLVAWRTNELQARTKYDSYASKANAWPPHVKRIIDRNALDEERHYEWVARVSQTMGLPGEGMETDLTSGLRERLNTLDVGGKVQVAADTVREKASDLTDTVREKASDLTDAARAGVASAADSARAGVASAAESARMGVASGIESAAHGLDRLADSQTAGDAGGVKARVGDVAHRVAGGMESTADFVRRADAATLQADLERQIRTSPVKSLLVLFATGFVVGRILR
ncbi:MAG: ferritin-like domain-containing protein [Gemmatimonadota bacterium]|nr:ferritin-like domain-containing protein [Gemmatimonadota bacterium]